MKKDFSKLRQNFCKRIFLLERYCSKCSISGVFGLSDPRDTCRDEINRLRSKNDALSPFCTIQLSWLHFHLKISRTWENIFPRNKKIKNVFPEFSGRFPGFPITPSELWEIWFWSRLFNSIQGVHDRLFGGEQRVVVKSDKIRYLPRFHCELAEIEIKV